MSSRLTLLRGRGRLPTAVLTLGVILLALAPVKGQTITWRGTTDSNWFLLDNWTPPQPTTARNVVIDTISPNSPVIMSLPAQAVTVVIGQSGQAELAIGSGGSLTVAGLITIAELAGSTGFLKIGAGTAPGTVNASGVGFGAGTGAIVFNTTGPEYVFAPQISGAGTVNVVAGSIVLTGSNTYTGGTNVFAGSTLRIGNGSTGNVTGPIDTSGQLIFNSAETIQPGAITGTGSVTQAGPGTVRLLGVHTYTGTTTIAAGTLQVGAAGISGSISGPVSIESGGTLRFAAASTAPTSVIVNSGLVSFLDNSTGGQAQFVNQAGGTIDFGGTTGPASGGQITAGSIEGAGSFVLGANTLTIGSNGLSTTVSGVISGVGGSLVKTGSGTLTLSSGANTYSGSTIISAGTLEIASDADLGASTLVLNGGALGNSDNFSLTRNVTLGSSGGTFFTGSGTMELAGVISGTGGLTKTGAGTLVLSGANTYTGATTVAAGALLVNGVQPAATGDVIVASGATVGGFGTLGGSVTIQNGGHVAPGASAGVLTVPSLSLNALSQLDYELSAPGGINDLLNVTGALILDGTLNITPLPGFGDGVYRLINYTGALTNNVLDIGAALVGAVPFGAIPGIDLFVQTSVPHQVNLINSTQSKLTYWDGGNTTLHDNNAVDGGAGVWSKSETSENRNWTEANGAINGKWAPNSGAVFQGQPGTVTVSASSGPPNFDGLQFLVDGYLITGGTLETNNAAALIDVGGGMTATVATAITGSAGGLDKIGTGTLVLSGTNTYARGTMVHAGTLQIAADAALGAAEGALALTGGTLHTTASFSSARSVTLGPSAATLLTDSATTLTLTGLVDGSGALTKSGAGTLVLSNANTYTGATIVTAGTLLVSGLQTASTGPVTVMGGATLGGSGSLGGAVTVENEGHLLGVQGQVLTTNALTLNQTSRVDVFPTNPSSTGFFKINGNLVLDGLLNITAAGGFGPGVYRIMDYTGALTDNEMEFGVIPPDFIPNVTLLIQTSVAQQVNVINAKSLGLLPFWDGNDSALFNNGQVDGGSGTWRASPVDTSWTASDGLVNGSWSSDGFAIFQGSPGTVTVDNGAGAVTFRGAQFAVDGYTITGEPLTTTSAATVIRVGDGTAAGAAMTATISASLQGPGGLDKTDVGTLVLAGPNTYAGGTTIAAGTLQIGNGGTTGSVVGNIVDDGALAFQRSDAVTFAGTVSGSGTLTQLGPGTLTLTGNNTYTGVTTIAAGTLQIGNGGTTGSISGNIVDNGALAFNRSDTVTFAGAVSGSGTLTQLGAGTLTLTGTNTFTGGTTISAGILQIGAGGTTGSVAGNIVDNGALVFNRSDAVTFAGTVSGSGTLTQLGPGTLTLTGANTYTGTTTVSAGTLLINGNQSGAPGAVSVAPGAMLGGTGTTVGAVTINSGGHLIPGAGGPGTLTTGTLTLNVGAMLDYQLNTPGVVGGPTNDLTSVNGNLTLNGALNISTTNASFLPGVYRLIDYTGALTNNGLAFGTVPSGALPGINLFVQTNVNQQVNLINSIGASLTYWDGGDPVLHDNNAVNGGAGIWANTANRNWTQSNGAINGPWSPAGVAIFGATSGIVTVDSTPAAGGPVIIGGATFNVSDYTIQGGALTLGQPATIVQVGDNSPAGAAITATITASLQGAGGLTKAGLGTLTLSGANTYTGGTVLGSTGVPGGVVVLGDPQAFGVYSDPATTATAGLVTAAGTSTMRTLTDLSIQNRVVVNAGAALTLDIASGTALTFNGVRSNGQGGAIDNSGSLTIGANVHFINSFSGGDQGGGAIRNRGTVVIGNNVVFDGNSQNLAAGFGGGAISNGQPGSSMLTIGTGARFTNNMAGGGGGAIRNANGSTLTIGDSADFVSNQSNGLGGAIENLGTLTPLTNPTFTTNRAGTRGGAIFNSGTLTLTNPTFTDNRATSQGGAINNDTTTSVVNLFVTEDRTFTGNFLTGAAPLNGGFLFNAGTVRVDVAAATTLTIGAAAATNRAFDTLAGPSTGTLNVTGPGTLVLNANSAAYTGAINVQAGRTLLGNAEATLGGVITVSTAGTIFGGVGTVTGPSLTVNNGSTLLVGLPDSGGVVTPGTLTVNAATFRLLNGARLTGAGTLTGTAGAQLGSSSGDIVTADVVGANALTVMTALTGAGGLGKIGAGTLMLTGTNTYTGGTTIAAGTLQIGNGGTTGSVVGNIVDNAALVFNRSDAVTFAGAVSGSGTLTQLGPGTLTLTGTNTYTGGTTIAAGTLQIGAGGTTGSIVANILDNAALAFNRSDSVTFSGTVSGSGTLTQLGPGTLTLTEANTYSGATTVAAGTLLINGNQSGATGAVSVASGATLGGVGTIGGAVTIQDGGHLAPGTTAGITGTLTVASLSLTGGSFLDYNLSTPPGLNDLINIAGALTLDGTLNITGSPGLGSGVYRLINHAGTLTDNGLVFGTVPAGILPGIDLFLQTSVAQQVNLIVSAGATLTFWDGGVPAVHDNGVVNGGSGIWDNTANRNWTQSDGAINGRWTPNGVATFQGAAGVVTVSNAGGPVVIGGATFNVSDYTIQGGALTLGQPATIVQVGDNTPAGAAVTATIAASLQGAGGLTKAGLGTLTLSGANTYTGGTVLGSAGVAGGVVVLGHDQALSIYSNPATTATAGLVTAAGTSTMRTFANRTITNRFLVNTGAAVTFDIAGGTALTFNSVRSDASGGAIDNSGSLTIGANTRFINSFSGGDQGGGAIRNRGTVVIGNDVVFESNSQNLAAGFGGGAISNGQQGFSSMLTIGTGARFSNNMAGGGGGAIRNSNGATLTIGDNAVFVDNRSNGLGGAIENLATFTLTNPTFTTNRAGTRGGAISNTGTLTLTNPTFTDNRATSRGGAINNSSVLNLFVTGDRTFTGNDVGTGTGGFLFNEGTFRVEVAAGTTLTIGAAAATNRALDTITGPGTLNVTGPGTLVLNADSAAHTGTINVQAGRTLLGNAQATLGGVIAVSTAGTIFGGVGTVTGPSLTVNNGSTLVVGLPDSSGVVTPGTLTVNAATFRLLNGARLTGAGTLTGTAGAQLGSSSGDVVTADVVGANALNVVSALTGTGGLGKTGAGTLTLTGTNTYTGGTTITAGTLQIGAGGTTGSIIGNIVDNAALVFNRSNAVTFAGAVSGSGTLTQLGPGTLTLAGTNTYTGSTTVSAGTLLINGNQSGATGAVSVASGATLGGMGTSGGNVTVADGGHLLGVQGQTLAMNALTLTPLSVVDVSLVNPGTTGLFNINGNSGGVGTANLVLDGTLNVAATGAFGPGVYRIMDYTGALTNNGLAFGTVPTGALPGINLFVQTSVDHQVNLINSIGASLTYWDGGNPTLHDNNAVNGGPGTWTNTANRNWTDLNGVINGPWTPAGVAIFQGTPGLVTVDSTLAAGGPVVIGGATFNVGGYTIQGDALQLAPGAAAPFMVGASTDTATIASALTGGNGLVKNGAGTLVLAGANTYAGGTTIAAGILSIASDTNLGDPAGGVTFNGGTLLTRAPIATGRAVTLGAAGGTIDNGGNATFVTGVISGPGGLTATGAGTLTLTGANSYTGPTTVSAGTLLINGNQTAATGAVSVASGATLGGTGTTGGAVTIASGGHLVPGTGGAGTLTTGTLTLNAGAMLDYQLNTPGVVGGPTNDLTSVNGNLTLNGMLDISTTNASFLTGVYRLIDYTGVLTNPTGTLQFGPTVPSGALPGINLFVQTRVNNQVNLINSIGVSLTYWDGGDPTLHDNNAVNGGTGTWTNTANRNWTQPDGALNGPWTPAGVATFQGAPGIVIVDSTLAAGGPVVIGGATFNVGGYTIRGDALQLAPGAAARFMVGASTDTATIISALSGGSGLVKNGAGTLVLAGDNTYTGGTTIAAGTLQIGNGGTTGSVAGNIANSGALVFHRSDVTYGGVVSGSGTLTQLGPGTLTLTGANTYTGGTTIDAGTLQIGNGGTTGSVAGNIANNAALAFNRSDAATYGGVVSGSGTLTQLGPGTLTLTGDNAYTGGTTIAAGILQIGDGGTMGSVVGNIVDNAALAFNRSDAVTYGGVVSGSGTLAQLGSGTLRLTGANSYTGTTTVAAGTLLINGNQTAATGAVTVAPGARLSGTGITGGQVTIADAGHLFGVQAKTFTMSALTLNPASQVDVTLAVPSPIGPFDINGNGGGPNAGNLALAGKLNVTDIAPFGPGVYRVMTYSGAFTDQGMTLGTVPPGFAAGVNLFIETAVARQVNLVNALGTTTINIWDGSNATLHNNGQIDGGNGTWQSTPANHSWTEVTGSINAGWQSNGFAIFQATPGTVTVDNSTGSVTFSGAQFAVDGYRIAGQPLTTTTADTILRVGDATLSGMGFTATIDAVIQGTGGINKTDLGRLILTGANTYSGGTTISQGVLQLGNGGTTGSLVGDVLDNGVLAFDRADTVTFGNRISGTGAVRQVGGGTTILTNVNPYTGGTTVAAGTLIATNVAALGTGAVTVNAALRFDVDAAHSGVLGNAISGSGGLTKTNGGNVTLNAANSSLGNVTIAGGQLTLAQSGAFRTTVGGFTIGDGTIAAFTEPATLQVATAFVVGNTGTLAVALPPGLTGDPKVTAASAVLGAHSTLEVTGFTPGSAAKASELPGTVYTLIHTANGIAGDFASVTFAGGATPDYLTVTAGKDLSGLNYNLGAGLTWYEPVPTSHGTFTLGGGAAFDVDIPLRDVAPNAAFGWDGRTLTKAGPGVLTLSAVNTYTGLTSILEGTVALARSGDLAASSGVDLAREGTVFTIAPASGDRTIQDLIGVAGSSVLLGANSLTAGTANNTLFAGSITGTGGFTKQGTGVITLTGENSSVGNLAIAGGQLTFAQRGAFQTTDGGFTIGNGTIAALTEPATLQVATEFAVGNSGTLFVALPPTPGGPKVTATSAVLGTQSVLHVTGFTPELVTKASELPGTVYTLIHTANGIAGDFATVNIAGIVTPDYLTFTAGKDVSGRDYNLGLGLRWHELVPRSHGTFTLVQGASFDVDVPLRDVAPNATFGWDGQTLTKVDVGVLTLSAVNTYTGLTGLLEGTVALAGAGDISASRGVVLAGAGTTFSIAAANGNRTIQDLSGVAGSTVTLGANTLTAGTSRNTVFEGTIGGAGGVVKQGSGALFLNGVNTYSGPTDVRAGAIVVGDNTHRDAALAGRGPVTVRLGALFGGFGTVAGSVTIEGQAPAAGSGAPVAQGVLGVGIGGGPPQPGSPSVSFRVQGTVTNAGIVQLGGAGAIGNALIAGSYAGQQGRIAMRTVLGGDTSLTDRLIVDGGTITGTTSLAITTTGTGALTTGDGILLVDTQRGATSAAGSFELGTEISTAGYDYALHRGGLGANLPDSWFLRSTYRAETSLYAAAAPLAQLYTQALIDTLHGRLGDQERLRGRKDLRNQRWINGAWGRVVFQQGEWDGGGLVADGPPLDHSVSAFQAGIDLYRREHNNGHRDHAGFQGGAGQMTSNVISDAGRDAGEARLDVTSIGGYWTHFGASGWYVDGLVQVSWIEARLRSSRTGFTTRGTSPAFSVEGGYPFRLGDATILEPQAQVIYQQVTFDTADDQFGAVVFDDGSSAAARIGARLAHTWRSTSQRAFTGWTRMNVWQNLSSRSSLRVGSATAPVPIGADLGGTWLDFGFGGDLPLGRLFTIYGDGTYSVGVNGNDRHSLIGKGGLRINW